MRNEKRLSTRRGFLGGAAAWALGGAAGGVLLGRPASSRPAPFRPGEPAASPARTSRVSLVHGESRAANTLAALRHIEPQIRAGLAGKKRVVIKPNMVSTSRQLAATHVDCLEGILEFLTPLFEGEIIVAESAASAPAAEGYANYGYHRLARNYRVRFVDLDLEPVTRRFVVDERHHVRQVRFSRLLADPDVYLVSCAVMKTHDRAVVTLSLKNIVFGGILKDTTFRWGRGGRGRNDKPIAHGGPHNEGLHWNLFQLARETPPDLAVLDGFQAMEHNGPVGGEPVDHRICVASTDWLAADRVGVELMGFDFDKIGYLTFCARGGLGQGDLSRIEVVGSKVKDHVRKYRPHDSIERQYGWM